MIYKLNALQISKSLTWKVVLILSILYQYKVLEANYRIEMNRLNLNWRK